MGYKNNIVIDFNQNMEAIAIKSTHREFDQLCLQVYNLVHKRHTITYERDEPVNIAEQVKSNISFRKIEFTTIKRISNLKLNRWGRQVEWKNQKHQDGVSKDNLHELERYYDQALFKTSMTVTIAFSNIHPVRN